MKDFDMLKRALDKGRIVFLCKNKDGGIKFGSSFEIEADIIGTKFSPSSTKSKNMPECVLIEKRSSTWIL